MTPADIKQKKPMITPEQRAKQKLANSLFSGGSSTKPKEPATKTQTTVPAGKKENPPKNEDSLIWAIFLI